MSGERGRFDALADRSSTVAAKSGFFVALVAAGLVWLALGPLADFSHRWVDALQVVGTIITLLLVALLENEQWRNAKATQRKLNALAEAMAHIMETDDPDSDQIEQLRASVGLEKRESISD
ncbi:MAG: low affinity iron permease family protein [Acidimicrobiales bacterium]